MERRDFIKSMFYTSAVTGAGVGSAVSFSNALASDGGFYIPRTLVNILLEGGADLRHLIVPHPDDPELTATDEENGRDYSYIDKFWEHRKALYPGYANFDALFDEVDGLYDEVSYETSPGVFKKFGIHKNAQWLKAQFELGNVAIIPNVYARHRRHDHAKLVVHSGDRTASQFIYDREGWGGRMANAIGDDINVVPVSHEVSLFCNSVNTSDRLDQVVHVKDSRNFALPTTTSSVTSRQSIMARALEAFYGKRGDEIEAKIINGDVPADWAYRRFFKHEKTLRDFGNAVRDRLTQVQPNQPAALTNLYTSSSSTKLNYTHFGKACANLYDCILARDILDLRIAYMAHDGWDTHNNQTSRIEDNIHDVFGASGGLDTLTNELASIPGANENMLYSFSSDFGRQLAVNGSNGTDHGWGTYMIVLGKPVNGGVYGDMFPLSEIELEDDKGTPTPRFDIGQRDIVGKTPFERVLYEVCEWTESGAADAVFPPEMMVDPESGAPLPGSENDLSALFKVGYLMSGSVSLKATGAHVSGVNMRIINGNVSVDVNVTTGNKGDYISSRLVNNMYMAIPSKNYFTFEPSWQLATISDGDKSGVDFLATPQLHCIYVYVNGPYWLNPDLTIIAFTGYNFVSGQTAVTIGGSVGAIANIGSNYLWITAPNGTTGEIVITTPTETYTHPVLFEDVSIGPQPVY